MFSRMSALGFPVRHSGGKGLKCFPQTRGCYILLLIEEFLFEGFLGYIWLSVNGKLSSG